MQAWRLLVDVLSAELKAVFWTSKYSFLLLGAAVILVAMGIVNSVPVLLVQMAIVGAFARVLVNVGEVSRRKWAAFLLLFVFSYGCVVVVADLVHGTFFHSILQLNGIFFFVLIAYKITFLCRVIAVQPPRAIA